MKMSHVQLGAGNSESEPLPTLEIEVLGVHHRLPMGEGNIGVLAVTVATHRVERRGRHATG
jgi:hypothetical protein